MSRTNFFVKVIDMAGMDLNECVNVLLDIGNKNIGNIKDIKLTYSGYKKLNESIDNYDCSDFGDFEYNLLSVIKERYENFRSLMGNEAMNYLFEDEEKDQEGIQKKNAEKIDISMKRKKKSEQSPLAKAIRSKGDSQSNAADKIGVDKSTISRIKTGKRRPSFDTMKELSDMYGTSVVNQLLSQG